MRWISRLSASSGLLLLVLLAGCGFSLRSSQALPFATIAVTPEPGDGVASLLKRYLGPAVRPVAPGRDGTPPEVILDIVRESRQKVIAGVNASGQVREYELRMLVVFKVRTPQGQELIGPTPIEQTRNISFSESAVLAKETEEGLLYRDMQIDTVQQLLRRLEMVHLPAATAPVPLAPASAAGS